MLPFLEPKKLASVVMAKHTEKGQEIEREEGEPMPEMLKAAESILSAISMKDATALARAFEMAFKIGRGE